MFARDPTSPESASFGPNRVAPSSCPRWQLASSDTKDAVGAGDRWPRVCAECPTWRQRVSGSSKPGVLYRRLTRYGNHVSHCARDFGLGASSTPTAPRRTRQILVDHQRTSLPLSSKSQATGIGPEAARASYCGRVAATHHPDVSYNHWPSLSSINKITVAVLALQGEGWALPPVNYGVDVRGHPP
ncbi:hypothetical protein GQ53DRAFT_289872 [Thozetella sp. PMI_491]|nr:hypothetical protein GQ53DRAFT_289872 [Thozetella sp. PMI_491]